MAEQSQDGQVANNGNGTVAAQEPSVSVEINVKEEIEKAKLDLEAKFKSEIAGLNRKNTELQEALKKKELEGKSEEEKNALLLEEKKKIEREIEELNRGRIIDKELNNAGLPLEFAKRIIGKDENEIKEDVKSLNEYISKLVQEKADKIINSRLGGSAPESGATPGQKGIDEQINEAQKAGDFTKVMALKELKKSSK